MNIEVNDFSSLKKIHKTEIKDEVIEILDEDPFQSEDVEDSKHLENSDVESNENVSLEDQLNSFLSFIHRDLKRSNDDNEKPVLQKSDIETQSQFTDCSENSQDLNSFLNNLHQNLNKTMQTKEVVKTNISGPKIKDYRKRIKQKEKEDDSKIKSTSEHRTTSFVDDSEDDFQWNETISELPNQQPELTNLEASSTVEPTPSLENELTCRFCKKEFPTKIQRHYHEKNMHPKSKVMCEECGELLNLRRLKVHKKKHMVVRKFQCDKCSKSFKDSYDLKRHINDTHDSSTNCFCDHCGKQLGCKKSLRKHMIQYHMSYLAKKCPECDKPFGDKARLTRHMTVHKRERGEFIEQIKKEECQICKKKFATSTHLKQHMGKHNQNREFKCRFCSSAFNFFSSCRNHEKNVHINKKAKKRKQKEIIQQKEAIVVESVPVVTNTVLQTKEVQLEHTKVIQTEQVIQPQHEISIFPQNILIAIPDGTEYYAITPLYCN